MRKPLLLALSLLLLVSSGSALAIKNPVDTYTRTNATPLRVADASGDVFYSLNEGENITCECVNEFDTITSPEGQNTITFYDDSSSASKTFFVDSRPPRIESKTPEGTIYEGTVPLNITYSDVSSLKASKIRLSLEGEPLNFTATQNSVETVLTNLTEGTYSVSYNIPDEYWRDDGASHNATGSWNFTLPVEPVLSGTAPEGLVGNSPTVETTARDPSGIDRSSSYTDVDGPENRRLEWDGSGVNVSSVDDGLSFAHTLSSLVDGEYTVTAHVEDASGNEAVETWDFTVDTTPPDLSFHFHVGGDVVKGSEKFEFNASDMTGVDHVNLSFGDQTATAVLEGGLYTATADTTPLEDGEHTVAVSAEDARGNRVTESLSIKVDNHGPVVEAVEIYPRNALGGVVISATARDSATSIIGSRFKIDGPDDETVTSGRMNPVQGEYDSSEERVRRVVDLEDFDLATGNYTALLMARDSAGHDYKWFGKEFRVNSSLEAGLEIEEKVFRQDIGTTSSFNVKVFNTGDVDELVSMSADSDVDVSVRPDEKRIGSGETKQFVLEVSLNGSEAALGNHSLTLEADGLSSSDSLATEIIGQPIPERREEIEASFQNLKARMEDLNQSRQEWDFSGDIEQQFEQTSQLVSEVERLLDEGRYTRAEQKMSAAEDDLQETEDAFTGEVTRARLGNLASAALKVLALLTVLGAVYGGYRLIPPEEGYDPERGYTHRPEGKHPLRMELEERWRKLTEERDKTGEEERQERTVERWSGYSA